MVATDAACEGLHLQTLGVLINVDHPWNPTKLKQRIPVSCQLRPDHETTQPFRTGVSMAVGEHTTTCLAPRVRAT
ncbi:MULTISPECIES: helicase-related protein [Pseudomonas]|uniref:Helicase C-terminal domain-containing protein n=2 Tax=Pseudomonas TaxID=286 RepID=A0ABT5NND9_9PSED|nr:hypothetical protein [Pseudomonas fontis]MDD0989686.1 hypothetical protein [Pseudomonas fontis]